MTLGINNNQIRPAAQIIASSNNAQQKTRLAPSYASTLHKMNFSFSNIFYTLFTPVRWVWYVTTYPFRTFFNGIVFCVTKIYKLVFPRKFELILTRIKEERLNAYLYFGNNKHFQSPYKGMTQKERQNKYQAHIKQGLELLETAFKIASSEYERKLLCFYKLDFLVFLQKDNTSEFQELSAKAISIFDHIPGWTSKQQYTHSTELIEMQREGIYPFEGECRDNFRFRDIPQIASYASRGLECSNRSEKYAKTKQEKAWIYFNKAVFSFFLEKEKEATEYLNVARGLGFDKSWADSMEKSFKRRIGDRSPVRSFFAHFPGV